MEILVEMTGLVELQDRLAGMQARALDLHPVLDVLAADFRVLEAGQFASEGARGGDVWAPLRPSTVQKRGSAHPILQVTEHLRDSLTQDGAMGAVQEITAITLTVGTKIPYAGFLQDGTRNMDGTLRMVARPPVALTPADRARWAAAIGKYVAP